MVMSFYLSCLMLSIAARPTWSVVQARCSLSPDSSLRRLVRVQLHGLSASERSFDVVGSIEAPNAESFEAQVKLTTAYRGTDGTRTCCTDDSCGSGCYARRQDELALLTPVFTRTPSAGLLAQLELRAQSSDGQLVSSCVGCTELPAIAFDDAQSQYCVDLSARVLGSGAEVVLGRQCSADGRADLLQRDTPEAEIPAICRAHSDAGVSADAGVEVDAAQPSDDVDADSVAETKPTSSSAGCNAAGGGEGSVWSLAALALFASWPRLRRRKR
jgi:MYXO-CTERM domain-containing protein